MDREREPVRLQRRFPPLSAGTAGARAGELRQIFIQHGDRCWIVPIADVVLLESEGNYTRVHFGTERPLVLRSLSTIEKRLNPIDFFRANRAQIVNLHRIDHLLADDDGRLRAALSHGRVVLMSRRASRNLRDTFSV